MPYPRKKPTKTVKEAAHSLLARRDHSKKELQQKLVQKGHEKTEVSAVLDQLEAKKLLNETRYIENFIRSKSNRGLGPERIRQELNARGIPADTIAEHLSLADNDWSLAAEKVWQKHFKGKMPLNYAEKAKHIRFLQYRGFTREHISNLFKDEEM